MKFLRVKHQETGGESPKAPLPRVTVAPPPHSRHETGSLLADGTGRTLPAGTVSALELDYANSPLTKLRRASENSSEGYEGDHKTKPSSFWSIGRRFMIKTNGMQAERSPYDVQEGRSGSYSSESTTQSSPPLTPTTPLTPPRLNSSGKDTHSFRYLGELPQLPPLSSLSSNADFDVSRNTALPATTGNDVVRRSRQLGACVHVSPKGSRAFSSHPQIAIPTPARTSSMAKDSSPRLTVSTLPTVSSANFLPNLSATDNSQSSFTDGSLFDESSDLLQAVLSLGDSSGSDGISTSPISPPLSSSPSTSAPIGVSSSFSKSAYHRPYGPSSLPRRMTEAQLAQLTEEERGQKSSTQLSRPKLTVRPGLFAARQVVDDADDSEDEYGEAERPDHDITSGSESDDDWQGARRDGTSAVNGRKAFKAGKGSKKLTSFLKSKGAAASSTLRTRTTPPVLARSPNMGHGDLKDASDMFPSNFTIGKKSRSAVSKLQSPTANLAPNASPELKIISGRSSPSAAESLPGLSSPAKRALYACTLLKIHPQLDTLLKVGVAGGSGGGSGSFVEIRYPRSINSSSKLQAASRSGGSQVGVAAAHISLGARRLEVALGQTKIMRKLRRRLPHSEEVEIGWFLKDFASELISPETIVRSLASRPQVSPEALATAPDGAATGESNAIDARSAVSHTEYGSSKSELPSNGVAVWASRKPFLDRCVMVRGEEQSPLNVGDVVVDVPNRAVTLAITSDTFRLGQSKGPKSKPNAQKVLAARPADLAYSPRLCVLAGLPANRTPYIHDAAATVTPSSKTARSPPPWIAPRTRQDFRTESFAHSKEEPAVPNRHILAAHEKLTRGASSPLSASINLLTPAQAVAAEARLRRSTHGEARTSDGRESLSVDADERRNIPSPEGDLGGETSGNEYFSADENSDAPAVDGDDDDDDDKPIAVLGKDCASPRAQYRNGEVSPSNSSSTLRATSSASSRAAPRQPDAENQRIIELEYQLQQLRQREQVREASLAAERAQLARIHAEQRRLAELEAQKRSLKAARERRAQTDHSDVLNDQNYGAGHPTLTDRHGRALRQSASMVSLGVNAAVGGLGPSWQPSSVPALDRRASQMDLSQMQLPSSGRATSPSPNAWHQHRAQLPASPQPEINARLMRSPQPHSASLSPSYVPTSGTGQRSRGVDPPSSPRNTSGHESSQFPSVSSRQSFQPYSYQGHSSSMVNLSSAYAGQTASAPSAFPNTFASSSHSLAAMTSQPNLLSHRGSVTSLASLHRSQQLPYNHHPTHRVPARPSIPMSSSIPHAHSSHPAIGFPQPLVMLRSTDVPSSALSARD